MRVQFRLLGQKTDPDPGHRNGVALDITVHSRHDPQETRLTRAVQTDDADFGAIKERELNIFNDYKFFIPDIETGFENKATTIYKYSNYQLQKIGWK
jgi:hypothetical protein